MNLKEVMTTDVLTVRPDAPLKDVARLLAERRISGVPVVSEDGQVLGVVSEGDILFKERSQSPGRGVLARLLDTDASGRQLKLEAVTAEEAMTSPARTIEPTKKVADAAQRMIEERVNRLPVVDEGKLVGIVTRADLVRAFVRSDAEIEREIREDVVLRTLWIAPETLGITVDNGGVTLSGNVESKAEAELVAAFAGRVPGVVSVDSQLSWLDEDERRR